MQIQLWSVPIPNFTFLIPAHHYLLPSNQKLNKIFTWAPCYFTFHKNITLKKGLLLKYIFYVKIVVLTSTFIITTTYVTVDLCVTKGITFIQTFVIVRQVVKKLNCDTNPHVRTHNGE
jgi:hypothetical protein